MKQLLKEYVGRTYQKPTVTELTTKHPMTTSHALEPPSGKSSSSSIVDGVVTWTTASAPRSFWPGFSSTGNIAGGEGGKRERKVKNLSQGLGHEVVNGTVIARKEVLPRLYIPSVMADDVSSLRTPLYTEVYVQSV